MSASANARAASARYGSDWASEAELLRGPPVWRFLEGLDFDLTSEMRAPDHARSIRATA